MRTTGGGPEVAGGVWAGRVTRDPGLGCKLKCSSPGTSEGLGAGVGAGVGWLVWPQAGPVADTVAVTIAALSISIEQARTRRAAFLVIVPTRLP